MASGQTQGAPPPQPGREVAAAAAVGVGADAAAGVAPAALAAAASAAIVSGLSAFLARRDHADAVWLEQHLAGRGTPADIRRAIAQERAFGATFAQRQAQRLRQDVAAAMQIADLREREQTLRSILEREERYAEQRAQAMAVRAFATLERFALKRESPQGAYWELGRTRTHDALCVAMAGRFWPWAVLDVTHPQHQPNCECRLRGYRAAVGARLMRPGDVVDVKDALSRAALAVRERDARVAGEFDAALEELELRARLVAEGLTSWGALAELDRGG